jgi:hypothetical protein
MFRLGSRPTVTRDIKEAWMVDTRNAYRILIGKFLGKRPLGRSRRRWKGNIEDRSQVVRRGGG